MTHMQGLSICQGYTGFCLNCILKVHVIWMSWVWNMLRFWMHQESKYTTSYKRFSIKCFIKYIFLGSEYTTVSKYVSVLNILGYTWSVYNLKPEFFFLFWTTLISSEFQKGVWEIMRYPWYCLWYCLQYHQCHSLLYPTHTTHASTPPL